MSQNTSYVTCALCFGRGYRGGGKLPTCRRCEGRGTVHIDTPNRDPWGWDPVKRVTTFNGEPVKP